MPNQGANDYPTAEDRNAIATNLEQLKGQLYQEGNTNYAGRYVFSGYKTDTSLVFNEATDNLKYEITEPIEAESIDRISIVVNEVNIQDYDPDDLNGVQIPLLTQYALRITSELPIVCQFGRLDTTQNAMAYYVGVGFAE